MTLPLTPYDERSLRAWLYRQLSQGKTPLSILEKALEHRSKRSSPGQKR
jgi:hypothetical protein